MAMLVQAVLATRVLVDLHMMGRAGLHIAVPEALATQGLVVGSSTVPGALHTLARVVASMTVQGVRPIPAPVGLHTAVREDLATQVLVVPATMVPAVGGVVQLCAIDVSP